MPADRPLVVVEPVKGALRIAALSREALALGLSPGLALADARARVPHLAVADHDPAADAACLDRMAEDCDRWTPLIAHDPPHGLVLDITGCASSFDTSSRPDARAPFSPCGRRWHREAVTDEGRTHHDRRVAPLIRPCSAGPPSPTRGEGASRGGETALRDRILARFRRGGFEVRGVIAGTPDAARALVRHGEARIVPPGGEAAAVRPLGIAALELPAETRLALTRAGLKRVADLADRPSRPVAARFGEEVASRLRRVLGHEDRCITPLRPLSACIVERAFAEPIAHDEAIMATLRDLVGQVGPLLAARGEGGRRFEASFFRSDGGVRRLSVATGRPMRDIATILRLFGERLDALADPLDPGFGFDLIRLAVPVVEPLTERQTSFDTRLPSPLRGGTDPRVRARGPGGGAAVVPLRMAPHPGPPLRFGSALPARGRAKEDHQNLAPLRIEPEIADLVDRLAARFGQGRVLRLSAADTHHPDRASRDLPAGDAPGAIVPWLPREPDDPPLRPLRLFDPPQPIETLAEVPDGAPARFRWRRVTHEVARAEGPERIAPEWWRGPEEPTRDYYRVEDAAGQRFWVFRAGLYGREAGEPRWYLHGLFA